MNKIYTLRVKREFRAEHFLVGGDWGKENSQHAHLYGLSAEIAGEELDSHGFLIDILDFETYLDELVTSFSGKILNYLPEFQRINPSIEIFCKRVHELLAPRLKRSNVKTLTVRIAEDNIAVAAYRADL